MTTLTGNLSRIQTPDASAMSARYPEFARENQSCPTQADILAEIAAGRGHYHPANTEQKTVLELYAEYEITKRVAARAPSVPSSTQVLGSALPAPSDFSAAGKSDIDDVQTPSGKTSLGRVAQLMYEKVSQGDRLHTDRIESYALWFEHLAEAFRAVVPQAEGIDEGLAAHRAAKAKLAQLLGLGKAQYAWEAAFTASNWEAMEVRAADEARKDAIEEKFDALEADGAKKDGMIARLAEKLGVSA